MFVVCLTNRSRAIVPVRLVANSLCELSIRPPTGDVREVRLVILPVESNGRQDVRHQSASLSAKRVDRIVSVRTNIIGLFEHRHAVRSQIWRSTPMSNPVGSMCLSYTENSRVTRTVSSTSNNSRQSSDVNKRHYCRT
jgi:hypothetical protein